MDFYDDLEILVCKHAVHVNTQRVNQPFDYYGIQFIVSGGVWLQVGSETRNGTGAANVFHTSRGTLFLWNLARTIQETLVCLFQRGASKTLCGIRAVARKNQRQALLFNHGAASLSAIVP